MMQAAKRTGMVQMIQEQQALSVAAAR